MKSDLQTFASCNYNKYLVNDNTLAGRECKRCNFQTPFSYGFAEETCDSCANVAGYISQTTDEDKYMFNVACKQNNIPDEFVDGGSGDTGSGGETTPVVDPDPVDNGDNGSSEEEEVDPNKPDIDLKPLDDDGNIIDEPAGGEENVT